MSLWKLIKSLKFRQITSLLVLFARHPLMPVPTARATTKSLDICRHLFPKRHRANGRANAFRHALWNVLLAREAMKWNKNPERSLAWAKQITDWHEQFAPNPEPARAMDLHNNAVGRDLFVKWLRSKTELTDAEIITKLKEVMAASKKITGVSDIRMHPGELVHIEDDPN
ncbi:DUF6973 domain-containing protein [Sinomicrobium weinanense]|uniref:DUF6973 domain-containing protein n=1 Tax=Sinomicrobium weinanense TaxID=2842200 RepID=A0A926JNM8_9FLAO|nr:hypothetical protein [Sinomicrobium weinanense]MBC9794623.1 hypothetical protein [Sinomicrobium weinanense]MBU3124108.1 hypothetical protein [Sinomicrobium weinanense]